MLVDKFDNTCYVYTWLDNKIKFLQIKCFKDKNKSSLLVSLNTILTNSSIKSTNAFVFTLTIRINI